MYVAIILKLIVLEKRVPMASRLDQLRPRSYHRARKSRPPQFYQLNCLYYIAVFSISDQCYCGNGTEGFSAQRNGFP